MKKYFLHTVLLGCFGLLSACSGELSPNTYLASEVGVSSKVKPGTIIGKRAIQVGNPSGAGGLAGAAAGAAGGSAIGGSGQAHIAGAIGGAVVGGIVGHAADKAIHTQKGFEYIIRLKDGATISITQTQELQFEINQHVLVIYGAMTRIIPDNTVEPKK